MSLYALELYHHGILGQKWGVRRYQNADGTLTARGKRHRANPDAQESEDKTHEDYKTSRKQISEMSNKEVADTAQRLANERRIADLQEQTYRSEHWVQAAVKDAAATAVSDITKNGANALIYSTAKKFGLSDESANLLVGVKPGNKKNNDDGDGGNKKKQDPPASSAPAAPERRAQAATSTEAAPAASTVSAPSTPAARSSASRANRPSASTKISDLLKKVKASSPEAGEAYRRTKKRANDADILMYSDVVVDEDFLSHSSKGTSWFKVNHKYKRKWVDDKGKTRYSYTYDNGETDNVGEDDSYVDGSGYMRDDGTYVCTIKYDTRDGKANLSELSAKALEKNKSKVGTIQNGIKVQRLEPEFVELKSGKTKSTAELVARDLSKKVDKFAVDTAKKLVKKTSDYIADSYKKDRELRAQGKDKYIEENLKLAYSLEPGMEYLAKKGIK